MLFEILLLVLNLGIFAYEQNLELERILKRFRQLNSEELRSRTLSDEFSLCTLLWISRTNRLGTLRGWIIISTFSPLLSRLIDP